MRMDRFVWLGVMPQQVEWKCAITEYGALCVVTSGILMMLELSADNSDYHS